MKVEDFLKETKIKTEKVKYRITKTKEKQDYVVLYLDNNEKINVDVETYFKYSLNKTEGIDEKTYTNLKQEERLLLAYRGALRKLSTKDFTIKQINDYLVFKKELTSQECNKIINQLVKYGLLDDEKYCINRVNYLNKQLLSIKQIKVKLINEGINKELIDKYVINNSEEEYEKVKRLAEKYSNSIKNKSLNATKQAILTKLVNAGYGYELSKDAVDYLNLKNDSELDLLKKEYLKANNKYKKKYADYELRNHVYSYLINKGFKSVDIKNVMEDKLWLNK